MNIKVYASKVNRDCLTKNELKELDFAFLQELFYEDSPNKDLFELTLSKQGFWYHRTKLFKKEEKQALCSFGVSPEIAVNPEKADSQSRPRIDKAILYPEFFQDECSRELEKKALKVTLKRFTSRWKLFFKQRNGVTTSFWGMAKGTPSYNEFMRRRIIDTSSILSELSTQCLIATPTVEALADGKSRIKQWQDFAERLSKLEKGLKKRFNIKMSVALESTKKLNPHAHIQIFLPFKFTDFKWRYSRSGKHKYICGGVLREAINELWGKEIVDLQECRPESAKWYLSKYSSKNMSLDCLKMAEKEEWSPDDIKEVATILLPMLSGVRQFRLPRLSKSQKESLQQKNAIQSCSPKPAYPLKKSSPTLTERDLEADREAVVLDCVRNNSPLPCLSRFFEGSFLGLKEVIGTDLDKWNEKPEEEKSKVLCKCECKSCSNCAYGLWSAQKVFGSGEMYTKNTVFDFFGKEIENLYQEYLKCSPEMKPYFTTLRSFAAQKAFFKLQMPSEWSDEEKESVYLTIENLHSCLWQFALSPKYAKWAKEVHISKTHFNSEKYFSKETGLCENSFLKFFPLTYSASGVMIKKTSKNGEEINE